jgi:hypothetical protein
MQSTKQFAAMLEISEAKASRLDSILASFTDGNLEAADVLNRANALIGGFGVESLRENGRTCEYVNVGDPYKMTLLYVPDEDEPFSFGCWGGFMEEIDADEAEDGNVRCGYCSEFTPIQDGEWHSTTCEHCGHCVSG